MSDIKWPNVNVRVSISLATNALQQISKTSLFRMSDSINLVNVSYSHAATMHLPIEAQRPFSSMGLREPVWLVPAGLDAGLLL